MSSPNPKPKLPRAGVVRRRSLSLPLTWEQAIALTLQELGRLGLAATHRVAALHSAPDVTAEGAPFAAIILPRPGGAVAARLEGWKLLISPEGQISRQAWQGRGPRAKLARG